MTTKKRNLEEQPSLFEQRIKEEGRNDQHNRNIIHPEKNKINLKSLDDLDNNYSNAYFQCGGPITKTKDLIWRKNLGNMNYVIKGDPEYGLPYGTVYRFLQIFLDTQITLHKYGKGEIQNHNGIPILFFGKSLRGLAKLLGMRTGGKDLNRLRDQFNRFARMKITVLVEDNKSGSTQEREIPLFIDSAFYWEKDDEGKKYLKSSYVKINPVYFEHARKHGQPLIPEVLRSIKKSAIKIDLYRILAYNYNRGYPYKMSTNEISQLIGISTKGMRQFIEALLKTIIPIIENTTGEKWHIRLKKGINIHKPPEVLFLPSGSDLSDEAPEDKKA